MSLIGLFGGNGVIQENYLQFLKYKYYVIDEEDIKNIVDFRIFKVLIFPSRFALYSKKTYEEIVSNKTFIVKIKDFLFKGGKIIVFPPLELPSDFSFSKFSTNTSITIDWLPINQILFRLARRTIKVKIANHIITKRLTNNIEIEIPGYFDFRKNTIHGIITNSKGDSIVTEIKIASGSIIFVGINLPFISDKMSLNDTSMILLKNLIDWGINTPSYSVYFDNLVLNIEEKYGKTISNLLRKADQSIYNNDFVNGCEYAFKAFEMIIKKEGNNTNLNNAINRVFSPSAKVQNFIKPENKICHSIREARNISFHGVKTPDEILVEEVEYFLSAIKYILKILL